MHVNTSDGAAAALTDLAAKQVVEPARKAKDKTCPDCGSRVINWYSANQMDPGDVEPRADCTNPDCSWGY